MTQREKLIELLKESELYGIYYYYTREDAEKALKEREINDCL